MHTYTLYVDAWGMEEFIPSFSLQGITDLSAVLKAKWSIQLSNSKVFLFLWQIQNASIASSSFIVSLKCGFCM